MALTDRGEQITVGARHRRRERWSSSSPRRGEDLVTRLADTVSDVAESLAATGAEVTDALLARSADINDTLETTGRAMADTIAERGREVNETLAAVGAELVESFDRPHRGDHPLDLRDRQPRRRDDLDATSRKSTRR